ncbi:unnamed protein product, partial [Amoebophrya sp. A120]
RQAPWSWRPSRTETPRSPPVATICAARNLRSTAKPRRRKAQRLRWTSSRRSPAAVTSTTNPRLSPQRPSRPRPNSVTICSRWRPTGGDDHCRTRSPTSIRRTIGGLGFPSTASRCVSMRMESPPARACLDRTAPAHRGVRPGRWLCASGTPTWSAKESGLTRACIAPRGKHKQPPRQDAPAVDVTSTAVVAKVL